MTNTKSEGLLDRLQALTNAKYLSDPCFMDYESIRTQLPRLNVGEYTLIQWLDAAEYLTGTKPDLDTPKKVYEHLLDFKKYCNSNC